MAELSYQQQLERAVKTPEGKMILQFLMKQAPGVMYNQEPLVFKGYMMATLSLKEIYDKE